MGQSTTKCPSRTNRVYTDGRVLEPIHTMISMPTYEPVFDLDIFGVLEG